MTEDSLTAVPPAATQAPRSLGQFQLRHLLGMMGAVSVLFALLAVQVQGLTPRSKISVVVQTVVLVFLVLGSLLFVLRRRQTVERLAGTPIIQVRRLAIRLLHWGVVAGFVFSYVAMLQVSLNKAQPDQIVNLLPNPFYLFFAVNYFVVRIWWRIDPTSPEACENGLIYGGFNYIPWSNISRYTWSGRDQLQLNLYQKNRTVMHLRTDPEFKERVAHLLAEKSPVETIAAAEQQ